MTDNKLIPGEALIYERADGVVYAKYRDPPHNKLPRWIIGGEPKKFLSYDDWNKIVEISKTNQVLKKHLDKLLNIYYIVKEDYDK